MSSLPNEFEAQMRAICVRTLRETTYRPMYFVRMMEERGAVAACKALLEDKPAASGFDRLWELKRLDLSIENAVLHPRFRELFSESEIAVATRRLHEAGYLMQDCGT